MRLLASLLLILVLSTSVAACGGDDDSGFPANPDPEPSPTAGPTEPSDDTGLGDVSITVYLARLHEGGLTLAPAQRTIAGGGSLGKAALEVMIKGPNTQEVADGFTTAIPSTARVIDVINNGGVVTVNLSAGSFPEAGSPNIGLARGQVERTLRQFPGVASVIIQIEGAVLP